MEITSVTIGMPVRDLQRSVAWYRDAGAGHGRLLRLGVDVGPLEHVEEAVDSVDCADPDGNVLGACSAPA